MRSSLFALVALVTATATASASLSSPEAAAQLLRRQAPGTPQYDCHSDCGMQIPNRDSLVLPSQWIESKTRSTRAPTLHSPSHKILKTPASDVIICRRRYQHRPNGELLRQQHLHGGPSSLFGMCARVQHLAVLW